MVNTLQRNYCEIKSASIALVCCLLLFIISPTKVYSESTSGERRSNSRGVNNLLNLNTDPNDFFTSTSSKKGNYPAAVEIISDETTESASDIQNTDDKKPEIIGNSVDLPVRFNALEATAPDKFKELVKNIQDGDYDAAKQSARGFVNYLQELMYMVREITHLTIEAMVENGEKDEEDVRGAEQLLDWQMAKARASSGVAVKPTHRNSLARIKKPDPEGKAEVYFFFTLNCRYCREMAPDVQRLVLSLKGDSRVRVIGHVLGKPPKELLKSFMDYTGLQIPVYPGEDAADALHLAFLPAIVVVSPSNNLSYIKTGQTSYQHLYEFVRTVQGLPIEMNANQVQLSSMVIGEYESLKKGSSASSFSVVSPQSKTSKQLLQQVTLASF